VHLVSYLKKKFPVSKQQLIVPTERGQSDDDDWPMNLSIIKHLVHCIFIL